MTTPASFDHAHWESVTSYRVKYADTDKMGVVYYGRYMEIFEVGRTEWIREFWRPYGDIEREGILLPVVNAGATYKRSFYYDDLIQIHSYPIGFTSARIRFGYELRCVGDERPRVTGLTEHAFLSSDNRTVRIPAGLKELLRERVPDSLPPVFHRTTDV